LSKVNGKTLEHRRLPSRGHHKSIPSKAIEVIPIQVALYLLDESIRALDRQVPPPEPQTKPKSKSMIVGVTFDPSRYMELE